MNNGKELHRHWREFFDCKYLGAWSVEEGERILTIKAAQHEEVANADGKKDKCLVLYFHEDERGMVLNATNAKTIEAVYKTGIVSEWVGKRIQLYATQVKAFGSVVPALRIREKVPADNKQQALNKLAEDVRQALANYEGDDRDDIRAMLTEKKKAGELTADLLRNTLETLKTPTHA